MKIEDMAGFTPATTINPTYKYPCLAYVQGFINHEKEDKVEDYLFPKVRVVVADKEYGDFGKVYLTESEEIWLNIYDFVDLEILERN